MEDRKEKTAPWLSVPQFGDWDQKGELPDYSLDFSKIREMRKQNKRDVSRASLGNEEDFINPSATATTTTTITATTSQRNPLRMFMMMMMTKTTTMMMMMMVMVVVVVVMEEIVFCFVSSHERKITVSFSATP